MADNTEIAIRLAQNSDRHVQTLDRNAATDQMRMDFQSIVGFYGIERARTIRDIAINHTTNETTLAILSDLLLE